MTRVIISLIHCYIFLCVYTIQCEDVAISNWNSMIRVTVVCNENLKLHNVSLARAQAGAVTIAADALAILPLLHKTLAQGEANICFQSEIASGKFPCPLPTCTFFLLILRR